jgi:hypothetical protein
MCIWCLRDGVFSDDDWKELLDEQMHQPSLMDRVKDFFKPSTTDGVGSLEEDTQSDGYANTASGPADKKL